MQRVLFSCLVLFACTLIAEDSPLVAAAKSRKNAKQKSKIVITNNTLSKTGGHISTTASQPPIALPKEEPKAEAQVRTIASEPAQAAKPKVEPPKPPPVDNATRYNEEREIDEYNRHPENPPIHILPKGMAIDPKTGKKAEETEKPPQ